VTDLDSHILYRKPKELIDMLGYRLWRQLMWNTYRRVFAGALEHHQMYFNALESHGIFQGVSSLFSIGPGDGVFESAWLSHGGQQLGYVETFKPHVKNLERRIMAQGMSDRIHERHLGGFQNVKVQFHYDLVVSIHSWFDFGTNEALLHKALSTCRPGGHLVIAVSNRDDGLTGQLLQKKGISTEALSKWANEIGFEHKLISINRELPIELFVQNKRITPLARDAISFFIGRPWFRIPLERRKEVSEKLIDLAGSGPLVRRYGCLVFRRH